MESKHLDDRPAHWGTVLSRVLRRRCPRCGRGRIFEGWYRERPSCDACGLHYERRGGDTWAFMYVTTAAFVAPVVLSVVVLRAYIEWVTSPVIVLVVGAVLVATLPIRKSLAVGVDYLIERRQPEPGSS